MTVKKKLNAKAIIHGAIVLATAVAAPELSHFLDPKIVAIAAAVVQIGNAIAALLDKTAGVAAESGS